MAIRSSVESDGTPIPSEAVANFFLCKAREEGVELSPLKIQKLIYYAHGWYLALTDKPLIDQEFEAWRYGPVLPSLYREFRDFQSGAITRPATVFAEEDFALIEPEIPEDPEVRKVLDKVWNVYSKFTAAQLSNMTHRPGSAWAKVVGKHNGKLPLGEKIADHLIKETFRAGVATEG